MKKLIRNTIIILILFVLGYVIRILTGIYWISRPSLYFWENETDYIYIIGYLLGNGLQTIAIIWALINVVKFIRSKKKSVS